MRIPLLAHPKLHESIYRQIEAALTALVASGKLAEENERYTCY